MPIRSQPAVGKNGHFPQCLGELIRTIPQLGPTDRWHSDRRDLLDRYGPYIGRHATVEEMTGKRGGRCRAALERFAVNHIGVAGDRGAQLALDVMRAPFNAPRPMHGPIASSYARCYGASQYVTHMQRDGHRESADRWWRRLVAGCDPVDESVLYVDPTTDDAFDVHKTPDGDVRR
jgi:hypothetical protein